MLDRAEGDPEQNLPYWSELWPSGIALAAAINRRPHLLRGQRVLELGGGLGVTATAALEAGARLLVTDYAPEALALCRWNTWRNTGHVPETMPINWRQPPPDLFAAAVAGYPTVLAADVLYERRDITPLLGLVQRLVVAGGVLWLAEPTRPVAAAFLEEMAARGWTRETETLTGPWPDEKDAGVVVRLHTLRKPIHPPGVVTGGGLEQHDEQDHDDDDGHDRQPDGRDRKRR